MGRKSAELRKNHHFIHASDRIYAVCSPAHLTAASACTGLVIGDDASSFSAQTAAVQYPAAHMEAGSNSATEPRGTGGILLGPRCHPMMLPAAPFKLKAPSVLVQGSLPPGAFASAVVMLMHMCSHPARIPQVSLRPNIFIVACCTNSQRWPYMDAHAPNV
jgi:hypothetical protein